jgi:predicted DNA-binding transcriptional regulator YafY
MVKPKQKQLIELLEAGPCRKTKLLERLHISERTLWRYKKDLAQEGLSLIVTRDLCRLIRIGCQEEVSQPAKDEDVRQLAILKLISECPLTQEQISEKLELRFDNCRSTVKSDLKKLVAKGFLAQEKEEYTLGEAMLPELNLSQEEGGRLLSYLIIKQQIEGKNAAYSSLVHALAGSMGKNSRLSWQQARRTTQRICIKGKQLEQELRERAMAERLELASWEERAVELLYKGEVRRVEPLGVVYSYHQDAWYLYAFCRKRQDRRIFRLEQIDELRVLEEEFSYPQDFDLKQTFACPWGIMLDEEPVQVKVRFYDEFNVLSRLKREVADRTGAKLTTEDGSVLYEDLVEGKNEFLVWVRSFGSSAEILTPVDWRDTLLDGVQEALSRYCEVRG